MGMQGALGRGVLWLVTSYYACIRAGSRYLSLYGQFITEGEMTQ